MGGNPGYVLIGLAGKDALPSVDLAPNSRERVNHISSHHLEFCYPISCEKWLSIFWLPNWLDIICVISNHEMFDPPDVFDVSTKKHLLKIAP